MLISAPIVDLNELKILSRVRDISYRSFLNGSSLCSALRLDNFNFNLTSHLSHQNIHQSSRYEFLLWEVSITVAVSR